MTQDAVRTSILVVEDTLGNQVLIRSVLQAGGYEVTLAADAHEADEAVARGSFDLILMDVTLPGEDGLSITRRLKSSPATAHIPVVALTAAAMKGDEEKALAAGCDRYLSKPFYPAVLLKQIQETLIGTRV